MNFLSSWFQLESIPADRIQGYYELDLVILSFVVAVLVSYVALTLVGRLREEQNTLSKIFWLIGGAFTMGAGIWSMHFIAMLAFIMPVPIEYEITWTLASFFMAILASAFALYMLRKDYSTSHLALSGLILGIAICTMHYMGMEAMRQHVHIHYIPGIFVLSIIIAIVAAEVALWLALRSNVGNSRQPLILKYISALIMGLAICGMHYTGMAASIFTPLPANHIPANQDIDPNYLAFFIAGITVLIIALALTVSSYYKRMVTAVQNERNFLNAMLNNLEDGIIACDENGKITVINQALQQHMNISIENVSISDLADKYELYTPDNQLIPNQDYPARRILRGEKVQSFPLIIKFGNRLIDAIIDGQPIINREGNTLGAVMVVHDVTELKHTEKLKSEFVSIVSHELRTPLTSIRGSLGLLVSGVMGKFPDKAQKLLEIANNNCERLLLLINDILDIEKIEAGKMEFQIETTNLSSIAKEAVENNRMYAEKYDTVLNLIDTEKSLFVNVDSSRLLQVLNNLISNACKFSPAKGTVTIEIKKFENRVRVSITDNGPGIPKEFQERIFQKFSQADSSDTRSKGGTGLGLSISKSILEKMGGALNFQSRPGEETTFYFDLPLVGQQDTVEGIRGDLNNEMRQLLICEDDETQAEYLKVLLETAGFEVDIATTGGQAKEKLAHKDYQALLLDLILPDQDGVSLIRELRTNPKTSDLHIIVLSVIAETGKSLLNGDAVSVLDWLDKPVNLTRLLASINRIKIHSLVPEILHIENNPDTQDVVRVLLQEHARLLTAGNLEEAKAKLKEQAFDLVILDLLLPDGNGVELLPVIAQYKTPVLVFSDMQLSNEYAQFVKQTLVKSNSSNEILLNTIKNLV